MPPEPPRLRQQLLVLVPALVVFILSAEQVLRIGFLADDYYGGDAIARHAAEHPGIVDRILTTFTRRWAPDLDFWHRPMVPLSFQADYAMFGANGRLHHLSSLVLWIGIAAAAASLW